MKKFLLSFILVTLVGLFISGPSFAHPRKSTYLEWTWRGEKSAYFMTTGSGIVHAWTYDHLQHGDARFIFKPLSKFDNAVEEGCDEGYLTENTDWNPQNLFNVMDTGYEDSFWDVFNDSTHYLLCVYPM